MLKFVSLFCFLVAACNNAAFAQNRQKIQEANLFMDTVLREAQMIVKSKNIDPAVLQPFEFKVKSNGFNRDLKVKIERAIMYGLSFGVSRAGDCTAPGWVGSNITVGCNIRFNGVNIVSNGSYKGSEIIAKTKPITINTQIMANTSVLVEATSFPNANVVLRSLQIRTPFYFSNTYQAPKGLDLNKAREAEMWQQLANNLGSQLTKILQYYYGPALNLAMNRLRLPTV